MMRYGSLDGPQLKRKPLIWNDLSSFGATSMSLFSVFDSFHSSWLWMKQRVNDRKRAYSTVIKLIFEGWSEGRTSLSFMRRELPRTRQRGLGTAQRLRGFSFPCHSRSLTLCFIVCCFVGLWDCFAYAAFASASRSTLEPIAQMNPTSSRATAVSTFPGCLLL